MSTPITQAALDAFRARVAFRGSTESDLVEGVTDLVATMARLERAHAAEREKVRALRSALQNLVDEQNDAPLERRREEWQEAMDEACAALAATEETK